MNSKRKMVCLLCTVMLSLFAVVWIIPPVWVVLNSFKSVTEFITSYTGLTNRWDYLRAVFPQTLRLSNYTALFTGVGVSSVSHIESMIMNSIIVSVSQAVIVVIITSLSAFAYERMKFPVGDKIFWLLFYLNLIPGAISIIPSYKIVYAIGWVNNLHALIWPCVAGMMNIFLLRNFMKSIPKELDEAATIDGASSLGVYLHVILPTMTPALMVVVLFAFKAGWNNYLWPIIVMSSPTKHTLTSGLTQLESQYGNSNNQITFLLAGTVISMIVPLLLYLTCQKYFIEGISIQASVKG